MTRVRQIKVGISDLGNVYKVFIFHHTIGDCKSNAASLQDGQLLFEQYLYKDIVHIYAAHLRYEGPKGCPTNPGHAKACFGTPPWTGLCPSQIPVSSSKSQSVPTPVTPSSPSE